MSELKILDTLVSLCFPYGSSSADWRMGADIEKLQQEDFTTVPVHKVHDWRNYIPRELQPIWSELSTETMLMAFFFAEGKANDEEWD